MDAAAAVRATLAPLAPALHAHCRQPWCLIGSAGLALLGVPDIACDDIDVLCHAEDVGVLERLWRGLRDEVYRPSHPQFRSRFARFRTVPLPLELMGGLELCVAGEWRPVGVAPEERVEIQGEAPIPVAGIAAQRRMLTTFGRAKDRQRLALLDAAFPRSPG